MNQISTHPFNLLSKPITSTDKTKEIEFFFTKESSGDFVIIENKSDKTRRGTFEIKVQPDKTELITLRFDEDYKPIYNTLTYKLDEVFVTDLKNALDTYQLVLP